MNIPKIGIDNQDNTNFNGKAIVRKYSYHPKRMKEIAAQLNAMKFVRNSEANVYIYSRYGDVVDVEAQKGAYNAARAFRAKVETVPVADAVVSAAKRSISKYEQNKRANRSTHTNVNKSIFQKVKEFFINIVK